MTDTIKPAAYAALESLEWMRLGGKNAYVTTTLYVTPAESVAEEPLYTRAQLDAAVAQERQECIDIVARHGGSIEIEAAIRARAALGE